MLAATEENYQLAYIPRVPTPIFSLFYSETWRFFSFLLRNLILQITLLKGLYKIIKQKQSAKKKANIYKHVCQQRASQLVPAVKNLPANAGNLRVAGSIPGSGRCPGEEHSNPLQHSYLENPMDRGAWWATVHRVTKSRIQPKWLNTHAHTPTTLALHVSIIFKRIYQGSKQFLNTFQKSIINLSHHLLISTN